MSPGRGCLTVASNRAAARRSSPALPVLVFSSVTKSLHQQAGDALRFLVGDEVACAGDRDHGCPGTGLKRAPLLVGEIAVTLVCVHDPRWHPCVAESFRWRVVPSEVSQVLAETLPHHPRVVPAEVGEELSTAIS